MSGRHQNTTWTAFDAAQLRALQADQQSPTWLCESLARVDPDPDLDPVHMKEVLETSPEIIRPYLLQRAFFADPPNYAKAVTEQIREQDTGYADTLFLGVAKAFELWSYPAVYGVLLYVSPTYARRFGVDTPMLPGAVAICDAFGGEPDPDVRDLRWALRDAKWLPGDVARIASHFATPIALPDLPFVVPHSVERFEIDTGHLVDVLTDVSDFYCRAATAQLSVDVKWHPNP